MSNIRQFASIQGGAPIHLAATIPTGTVTYGTPVDMLSYDSALIYFTVGTAQGGTTTQLVWQWSLDGSAWGTEPVDVIQTVTSTTQPYNARDRVVNFPMDTAGKIYPVRVHRMGAFLRAGILTANVTTGTVSIQIIKLSNFN